MMGFSEHHGAAQLSYERKRSSGMPTNNIKLVSFPSSLGSSSRLDAVGRDKGARGRHPEAWLCLISSRQQLAARFVDQVAASRNGNNLTDEAARPCNDLVARSIGIVTAAISSVSSDGSCSNCSSSDAYRHPAAHGCSTVDATAIDTTVVNANATNSNASPICEGVG
jgi:hypothetical protein